MSIDRHHRAVEEDSLYDVGGLAADAGEGLEEFDIVGNNAVEVRHQLARHSAEVLAFVVGVGNRFYVLIDILDRGGSHRSGIGEGFEEGRGHHVDTLVGTLSRQDDSHEELERVLVVELALGVGAFALKILY